MDDIIFDPTNPTLREKFSKYMHSEFEMSMIGELSFFLLRLKSNNSKMAFSKVKKNTQGICSRDSNSKKIELQKLL